MKFRPAAATLMRTWPAGGSGTATSSSFSTSGPPVACTRIAFIVVAIASARAAYHRYDIVPPVGETLKTAEIAALAKDLGETKAPRFGAMAGGLRGSEILR